MLTRLRRLGVNVIEARHELIGYKLIDLYLETKQADLRGKDSGRIEVEQGIADLEFEPMAPQIAAGGFEYSLERVIDDFILMCVLIGNDFLPHMPSLDIADGSLDILFDSYRALLPSLGGYLCDGPTIDTARLQ